jgi:hypothetical protein
MSLAKAKIIQFYATEQDFATLSRLVEYLHPNDHWGHPQDPIIYRASLTCQSFYLRNIFKLPQLLHTYTS